MGRQNRCAAFDGRSRRNTIKFVQRPIVTEQFAFVVLPEFCGRTPTTKARYEVLQLRGDVSGILGSDVKIIAKIQKPVESVVVEVLALRLEDPPVYFASSNADPRLKDYGFNAFATSYDQAAKHGFQAYLANLGHTAIPFQSKPIGWSNFSQKHSPIKLGKSVTISKFLSCAN